MRDARRLKMVKPTEEQARVEQMFPAIARWARGYGHIEIGDQEISGFVAKALDYGGEKSGRAYCSLFRCRAALENDFLRSIPFDRAIRLTEPAWRPSSAAIFDAPAPARTSLSSRWISLSLHCFGFSVFIFVPRSSAQVDLHKVDLHKVNLNL